MSSSSLRHPPVVVFGASGFIGGALAHTLEQTGYNVIPLTSRDADFANADEVQCLHSRIPQGALWILAAARSPDYPGDAVANAQASLRTTENLCALAESCAPLGIVFLSSIDVYGRHGLTLPLSESSPLHPETPFASMKVETEASAAQAAAILGIPLLTLRLPGVYGAGDSHHGPVRSFMDAALRGEAIRIYGDGEQLRDLLYVEDLSHIVQQWLSMPRTILSNAVTGTSVSLNAMVEMLRESTGLPLPVEYHPASSQIDIVFQTPALRAQYSDLALTPIRQGIAATWHAVSANVLTGSTNET